MPDGLYEGDILLWAEQQAALLQRLAEGERVNAEIDWPNLIEEVGDLGLSELRAVESNVRQALIHLLKITVYPDGPAAHWRGEINGFLTEAQSRFTPSMNRRISLEKLYRQACRQVLTSARPGLCGENLPSTCPVALEDLLNEELDLAHLERSFAIKV